MRWARINLCSTVPVGLPLNCSSRPCVGTAAHRLLSTSGRTADHYAALAVRREADTSEIKRAFYVAAKAHHPDTNPDDPDAAGRFQQLTRAYEVLSDPLQRREYDLSASVHYADVDDDAGGSYGFQRHARTSQRHGWKGRQRTHPNTPFWGSDFDEEEHERAARELRKFMRDMGLGNARFASNLWAEGFAQAIEREWAGWSRSPRRNKGRRRGTTMTWKDEMTPYFQSGRAEGSLSAEAYAKWCERKKKTPRDIVFRVTCKRTGRRRGTVWKRLVWRGRGASVRWGRVPR